MKYSIIYVFLLWIFPNLILVSQTQKLYSLVELKSQKTYKEIEEIKKNPQKVIVIDLGDKDLKEMPSIIAECKNLQKLVMYGNKLKTIPDFITQLKNLRYIDFYNNQLKKLPADFSNLENLLYIDMGNNRFKTIPDEIFKLKTLTHLFLYGNRLKKIDTKIGELKNLEELRLGKGLKILFGGNAIKKLPESIGELTALKELHVPDTRLRALPASFKNLQKLEWLETANVVFKKMPDVLADLPNLRYVSFFDNFNQKEKENLAQKKPKLTTLYDKKYEGNFWALNIGARQGNFTDVELGIAKCFKKDLIVLALQTSAIYQIQNQNFGAMIGGQANSLISVGLFGGAWLNQNTNFFIRPQIGFGKGIWSVNYNYDILFGKNTEKLNSHSVRISALIPLKPHF